MTTRHVFLVDDDADTLWVLARRIKTLLASGWELLTATRGQEALDLMKNRAGPGDILITDHGLPDLTGLQVAESAPSGVQCHVFSGHPPLSARSRREVVDLDEVDDLLPEWLSAA